MFCLRSWIPILFFLTNASPVYLILFISATYFLNRPCVYCSILLAILVIALFDFSTPWFESPLSWGNSLDSASNGTMPSTLETISMLASAANTTAQAVAKAAVDSLRDKFASAPQADNGAGYDFVKGFVGKKEWRIPCLDVLVRI